MIYKNPGNKYLIVFDKKGNHESIKNLVKQRKKKPVDIIELKEQPEESAQLNAYKGKIFDSNALNNNNNNSPHKTPIVSQKNEGPGFS